jgi:lipoate-protein ligase A
MTAGSTDGTWRVIADDGGRDAPRNLALDEALGRMAGPVPTLRLWRNGPCVVLGRFQVAAAEVDARACRALGVPVYRRFTGGGAVYQDPGYLTVTLALRRDDPRLAGRTELSRLPGLYRLVLEPLAEAARSFGSAAVAAERDLMVGRTKLGGVAAWIGREALLVHGTLLVDADLVTLESVLAGPGAPGDPRWERTRSRRSPVTSLARQAAATGTPGPAAATVDAAVVAAVTHGAGRAGSVTEDEAASTDRLWQARYAQPSWHEHG